MRVRCSSWIFGTSAWASSADFLPAMPSAMPFCTTATSSGVRSKVEIDWLMSTPSE
jgi:hypothetical protein